MPQFTIPASFTLDADSYERAVERVVGFIDYGLEVCNDEGDIVEAGVCPPDQYLLIQGNPLDGFDYTGPFSSFDEAVQAGDSTRNDWWVHKLNAPQG